MYSLNQFTHMSLLIFYFALFHKFEIFFLPESFSCPCNLKISHQGRFYSWKWKCFKIFQTETIETASLQFFFLKIFLNQCSYHIYRTLIIWFIKKFGFFFKIQKQFICIHNKLKHELKISHMPLIVGYKLISASSYHSRSTLFNIIIKIRKLKI